MTGAPHENDPLELLRAPESAPAPGGGHSHDDILRRVSRRRTRSAATLGAAVLTTLTVVVGIPLLATGLGDESAPVATAPPVVTSPTPPTSGDVADGFVARGFSFTSAQVGYALGEAPCETAPCTSVAVTADGGQTWAQAESAPGTGDVAGRGGVDEIRYSADGSDAWAFGGELWTRHGGDFAQVTLPGTESAIGLEVTGARAVAALGECDGAQCASTRITSAPEESDDFAALPGASALPGRASIAVAGGTVWAVSVQEGTTTLVRGPADGAEAMVALPAPCAPGTVEAGISATTDQVVITCRTDGDGGTAVHASDDRGASWTRTSPGLPVQAGAPTLLGSGTLLLAGVDGSVQRSTDLGRTVSTVLAQSYLGPIRPLGSAAAAGLAPDGRLVRSTDDGSTWQELAIR